MLQSFASSSSLTEDSQADRHLMLRAIGINPDAPRSDSSVGKTNLDKIKQLIAAGLRVDGCRDRHGSTALGVAAQLGKTDAMKLLIEGGANLEAVNLDDATPLSLAVFGKQAAAVAMLLVYGNDDGIEYGEALNDARATGARDVLAVFDAWEEGERHPLIEKAEGLYASSEPLIAARKAAAAEAEREGRKSGADVAQWKARAEAAEAEVFELEERCKAAEAKAAEMERRALAAEAAARVGRRGSFMSRNSTAGSGSSSDRKTQSQPMGGFFNMFVGGGKEESSSDNNGRQTIGRPGLLPSFGSFVNRKSEVSSGKGDESSRKSRLTRGATFGGRKSSSEKELVA